MFTDAISQSVTQIIDSCVDIERRNGAKEIIVSADFRGYYNYTNNDRCFIFVKDTNDIYFVKCLVFLDVANQTKVIVDSVFYHRGISNIFSIENGIHDSVTNQIKKLDELLLYKRYENGRLILTVLSDGGIRYLGILDADSFVRSFTPLVDLNRLFSKAKYYWILNSSINNFVIDHLDWFPKGSEKTERKKLQIRR